MPFGRSKRTAERLGVTFPICGLDQSEHPFVGLLRTHKGYNSSNPEYTNWKKRAKRGWVFNSAWWGYTDFVLETRLIGLLFSLLSIVFAIGTNNIPGITYLVFAIQMFFFPFGRRNSGLMLHII